ncbi:beta-mannosidase-like [Anthonomus grandis grandis]|uniref:beta-mannosidase-like n=1 Tax=Anthonomus grandis grandis TaxID=2921223 RepID=UPI002165782B|nr:beta-mannosidase-like [Anthonomus grandis grandis]
MRLFIFFLALFVAQCHGRSSMTQSLDGTWVGKETEYWYEFPVTVPGGVYTDLMNVGIFEDVFYGYNDNSSRWAGQINWTYALNFTVDEGLLDRDHVNIVFEGVDTFATIVINNVTVGETSNMFVRYVFDVKPILKAEGNNTIKVFFQSPIERALNLNNKQLEKYVIPWQCPPDEYRGECHINMIRKMQASFSWDWGPAFPSMGLWKPVFLEAYDETRIRHIVTRVSNSEDGESWVVSVDTYFALNEKKRVEGSLNVKINIDFESISKNVEVNETVNTNGELVKSASLVVKKQLVHLWWPNGYGSQPLYEVEVTFASAQASDDVLSKKVKIGFRTVELVQETLDTGATFYFKINGEPIFAKGSNEIPINVLPELGQDRQTIRHLLQSAKDVNMNMLRVWGGGVYESDYFYEVADQLGIMIWQDFMFACSLYPATEEFLSNVVEEVNHNVKRLLHHPSVVVYSGNNENEGVLADNWYGTQDNYDQYKKDYVALYITTVRSELDRISGGQAVFISSSPTNGNLTEKEGWVGSSPGNQYWGDVHFYNYILDPWDSSTYPIPRFCSEYGYQSLPFEDAWMTATNNVSDLQINSKFMDWRQHHPEGNGEMALLIAENLAMPDSSSANYTSAFIYLSEVYTAQAIKVETEHYRRYRSYLTDDGRGKTMGALYWQLNDVWVAPTWSSIDYTGRWKMLHYFAKDFFSHVIVTGHINGARELQIYTVNDNLSPVEDVSVLVRLYKYNSPDFRPVYENRISLNLEAGSSQLIQTIQTDTFLAEQNCDKNSCFFHYVIHKNASLTDTVAISPENYVFPGKLKNSDLALANVQISDVKKSGTKTFVVTVTTDNIALFVWLDSHNVRGTFSENGFLLTQSNRTVTFKSNDDVTLEALKNALSVTHLKDPKYA